MQNTTPPKTRFAPSLLPLLIFILLPFAGSAQTATVVSSTGYHVNIDILGLHLVPLTSPCTWGYSYKIEVAYTVTFSGTNPPATLYTLQGTVGCTDANIFFDLPNGPSSGTVLSSNSYRNAPDCETANALTLGCNTVNIEIEGPGIGSQHVLINAATLPITLVSFQAEAAAGAVYLAWATATEQDNAQFTVERSADAQQFTPVLHLPGAGNSGQMLHYTATDDAPLPGVSYYRLRQTDIDGASTVSDVVAVANTANPRQPLMAWPNPANTPAVELPRVRDRQVEIRTLTGALVRSTQLAGTTLPCQSLAPGAYLLRVTDPATGTSEQCSLVRY